MKIRYAALAAAALLTLGFSTPADASGSPHGPKAGTTTTTEVLADGTTIVTEVTYGPEINPGGKGYALCRTFSYKDTAIDFPSYQELAWHRMTIYFCYTGSAISGTPVITYHSADSTAYGTALGVDWRVTGLSGPSKLSTYQWTSTGYADYVQCIVGTSIGCFRSRSTYITLNPQGSGAVGWAHS